jgi:cell division protein FtsX
MKQNHATAVLIAVSLITPALLLTSCGSSQTVHNRLVPQAQAEADLKRALDVGAISQSEYQEQLKKLRSGD